MNHWEIILSSPIMSGLPSQAINPAMVNMCTFCHKPCSEGYFHAWCAKNCVNYSAGGYIDSSDESAPQEQERWNAEGERMRAALAKSKSDA